MSRLKPLVARSAGCAAILGALSCGTSGGTAAVDAADAPLTLNTDSWLYFLCNSTGFAPSEANRLKSTSNPALFTLTYGVAQPHPDGCSFVQTNQLNGWGTTQSRFAKRDPWVALTVPASDALLPSWQSFSVNYPSAGEFQLTVDWQQQTFSLASPEPADPTGLITGRVTVATTIGGGWGVSGVRVTLNGPETASTLTDSNGVYRFSRLPSGEYTVRVAKASATFASSEATVQVTSSSIQDFTCESPCGNTSEIDPARELVIAHPAVTNDWRASNAVNGPWSFRFMLEQLTPAGVDPAVFAQGWLNQFLATQVNGFSVDPRAIEALTGGPEPLWPSICDDAGLNCKLDMARAPFKLLAIFNRTDLHATGSGEGRMVYGIVTGANPARQMTVIFEYGLPNDATLPDRKAWVAAFHELSSSSTPLPLSPNGVTAEGGIPAQPSSDYVVALQAITDRFTRAGVVQSSASNPLGSALIDLRTSESILANGRPWEFREFRLRVNSTPDPTRCNFAGPCLELATNAQTPDDTMNAASFRFPSARIQELAAFIMTNDGADVLGGLAVVPPGFLGGLSQAPDVPRWDFANTPTPPPERVRHAFGGQTCNGCHTSEATLTSLNLDNFYHVSPQRDPGPDGTALLSPFIRIVEIPRRISFALSQLSCAGAECPVGGEAMMGP